MHALQSLFSYCHFFVGFFFAFDAAELDQGFAFDASFFLDHFVVSYASKERQNRGTLLTIESYRSAEATL